jgi:hypothetical protein
MVFYFSSSVYQRGSLGHKILGTYRVYEVVKIVDNLRKHFLGLLVKITHGNPCSEDGIIWVSNSHVCRSFGSLYNTFNM